MLKHRLLRKLSCATAIGACMGLGTTAAWAEGAPIEMPTYEAGNFSLTTNAEVSIYHNNSRNANFGSGITDLQNSTSHSSDTTWWEYHLKLGGDATYKTDHGDLYGGVKFLFNKQTDLDAAGFSHDGDGGAHVEQAFAGWRSGSLIDESKGVNFDLSFGAQEYVIGDGFMVADGNPDIFDDGGYWTAPRRAFRNTVIAKVTAGPMKAEAFFLRSDKHADSTKVLGGNLEYTSDDYGTLGVTALDVLDSNNVFNTSRDGRKALNFRAHTTPIPGFKDFGLNAEYVKQKTSKGTKVDAYSYYVNPSYTFSSLPWSPRLSYRYAKWSGDDTSTTDTNEGYDPMFYSFTSWGTWLQGEITGNFHLFNSNQVSQMVDLSVSPTEQIMLNFMFFDNNLAENNLNGTAVQTKNYNKEFNLNALYFPKEWLTLGATYAVASPDGAAQQAFSGFDAKQKMFQLFAVMNF